MTELPSTGCGAGLRHENSRDTTGGLKVKKNLSRMDYNNLVKLIEI